jgi:hypothetical protein
VTDHRNPFQEILSAVPAEKTGADPIYLYVTGDEDGPDIFGLIYDDEDDAVECARDNDLSVWRVPFTPDLANAEYIEVGEDDD